MTRMHWIWGILALSLASFALAGPETRRGVVKKDACGRTYVAAANARKDVSETEPNFAARNRCTWKVGADRLCRCVREVGQTPSHLQGMKLKRRARGGGR